MRVSAGAAGVMQGGRAVQPVRAFRQADLFQHIPDAGDLAADGLGEFFSAGRAARNNDGITELRKLLQQEFARRILHLVTPGPVADRAAAAQHQRHAAFEPLTQVQVSGLHRLGRDSHGLAAGEEHVFTLLKTGLRPCKEGIAVGEDHIHQGKLMRGKRHLVGRDHVPPRRRADMGHIKAVRADHRALPAKCAGVHRLVQLVVAHNDLRVIKDFAGQKPRVFFVVFQVGAALHALVAVALNAARGFGGGFLFGVASVLCRNALQFLCRRKIRIQAAIKRVFLTAHVARIKVLRQAVYGQGCFFCTEGRVHHPVGIPGHELLFLTVHELRYEARIRKQAREHRPGNTEHIKGRTLFRQEIRGDVAGEYKRDVLSLQTLQLQLEGFVIQEFRLAAQEALQVRLFAENGERIGLFLDLSRQKQCKQPGTEYGNRLFLLGAEDPAEPLSLAEARDRRFHPADGNAVAALTQAALLLAGRVTARGHNEREGRDLFIQLQCFFEVPGRCGLQHGAGVELQRAGGVAEGRFLIDAARYHVLHFFLGDFVYLVDVGRATFLNLCHRRPPNNSQLEYGTIVFAEHREAPKGLSIITLLWQFGKRDSPFSAFPYLTSFSAASTLSGVAGMRVTRAPVAAKMAFRTAG